MSDRAEDSFDSSAAGESTSKLTPLAGLLYLPLWHQGLQFLGQTARDHPELLKVTQKSLLFEVPQPCCFLPQSHCRNKESSKMGAAPIYIITCNIISPLHKYVCNITNHVSAWAVVLYFCEGKIDSSE